MLQDVQDVITRVGVLLDDPGNAVFTSTYLLPWIDQEFDILDTELELLGMQYTEGIAVIPLDPNTTDLTPFLTDGQPLATMKFPKKIKWKLTSQPDTSYSWSVRTDELDDVPAASIGALEFVFTDGAIQVTPSGTPVTLKIYYEMLATNIVDPVGNVIRGTAHILALRVAKEIAVIRGMPQAQNLTMKSGKAWDDFAGVLSKQNQGKRKIVPRIHSTARRAFPAGYA
jgi:hypothetical protein